MVFTYLSLELIKLWNVVEDRREDGNDKQKSFSRKMFERVDDGKVSLNRHRDCDENWPDPTDVPEPETHRQDEDVDGSSVPR